jgi:prephenate dehydratase
MNSLPASAKTTVVFQGFPGSFSSMAARALYGSEINSIHAMQFREIFERVMDGSADVGVVPIENAVAGSVHENFDLLGEYPCSIIAEAYIPVQLHVMAPPSRTTTSKVYSHPKALEQCSFFLEHHPEIEAVVWSDTAGAARHVALQGDPCLAAIASEEAASIHGLTIFERSVQNHPNNATRFVAIAKNPGIEPNPTKCSLIVSLAHKPGSLYRVLGEIAKLDLNLTKLESRPILGEPFSYSFHIDIECAPNHSTELLKATELIAATAEKLKILGFYRYSR